MQYCDEDDIAKSLGLANNSVITSQSSNYKIIKLLGEGGFGAVFLVSSSSKENVKYALKVEKKTAKRKDPKLQMEVSILENLKKSEKSEHFTEIVDKGKTSTYYFVVMELVGKSLADIKDKLGKVFTLGCGIRTMMQCADAISAFHALGFIHRDLKPGNFCVGTLDKRRNIYLLDFGMARKFLNDKGEIKRPRRQVNFKGTLKFAPIRLHQGNEYSRKDDAESWFYMLEDLVNKRGLPWKKIGDMNLIRISKEDSRKPENLQRLIGDFPCKAEFEKVLSYIDKLDYVHSVDFAYINSIMEEAAKVIQNTPEDPYDWESLPEEW
ncbi:Protein kinase domain and Serine/threonine-/dual specificity protein kinase, catalytic domain and Protein kinase-like domain-containing protein [Strongyloides ratti]|uniref:non-specific serine/threonine protein kinase n=1 Tax=Strongyloides ratti TaxID=34506 RepID=A0A090L4N5_STRRB|nr:Protein kinase domain and Serine/threonine-/dual specificity protein kinase, catalytic domain and Protein kinase-like domain-containing protein [Strongyloides ratti]CEF64741.1 Protein kinase domain and Serine/threonine-/dual specificity protein kinase, catalytic domain and Protein kinase-like domain-containing protein [Strongyloides ratti]